MDWTAIIQTVGLAGVALAALAWLSREVVKRWLADGLESHKQALQMQLQEHRDQLERQALEHQVRFSRLHETQAEIIAEVFAHLERVHQTYRRWTSIIHPAEPTKQEIQDEVVKQMTDFTDYYYSRAIWLDRDICNDINELIDELHSIFIEFSHEIARKGVPEDRDRWLELYRRVGEGKVPQLRGKLDGRFRALLGVLEGRSSDGESSPPEETEET